MDQLYFSSSTNGFYSRDIHGDDRPADCVEVPLEVHALLMEAQSDGYTIRSGENGMPVAIPPQRPTPEQMNATISAAVQAALNVLARSRGYDDCTSVCSYASDTPALAESDPNFALCEKFRLEGNAFKAYRAKVWALNYAYLATVAAGTNEMPTPKDAVAMMPAFTWPD
jgi:hypothetical protein